MSYVTDWHQSFWVENLLGGGLLTRPTSIKYLMFPPSQLLTFFDGFVFEFSNHIAVMAYERIQQPY